MMTPEKPERFITPLQQVICSCTGAFISSTCTTPLDVVKIRLQAQQKAAQTAIRSEHAAHQALYRSAAAENLCLCTECNIASDALPSMSRIAATESLKHPKFTGVWDAMFKIARSEGVTVLWSGLPTTWLMAVPATAVYFATYDQMKYRLGYREDDKRTMYVPVLAGSLARVFAATLISPLELVRTKMQSEVLSYSELRRSVIYSVRQNGVVFMMRGLGPSLLRDVPFSAIYWLTYESVKSYNLEKNGVSDPTVLQTFTAGAVSGTIAAVLTVPFDVIKTHRQIDLGDSLNQQSRKFVSTWTLIFELYQKNGIKSLYAGTVPRVMKVTPACAIMISIYESGKSFFKSRNAQYST